MHSSNSLQPTRPRHLVPVTSAGVLALLVLLSLCLAHGAAGWAQVPGSTVHYSAGWNLVAAPTGSVLDKALPPYFAYGPTGNAYLPVGPGAIVGGRAVWAFFPTDVDVPLARTAADSTRVQAPADRWVLLGDPSTTTPLAIVGADAALGYSATQGYVPVSAVQPGQGVWVLRHTAGPIRLANATATSFEQRLSGLQTALTADPTGQLSYDQATALGGELIAARDYAAIQDAADDLQVTVTDGLLEQGATALPAPSSLQLGAAATVREALAGAQAATAAGDTATADGLVEQAKQAAKASADDAVSLARGQGDAAVVGYASAGTRTTATPATLSAFGALIRAGMLSVALGQPLGSDFWTVASAVLQGQSVPPAPTPTTLAAATPPATTLVVSSPAPTPAPPTVVAVLLLPNPGAGPTPSPTSRPTPSPTPPPTPSPTPSPTPPPTPSPTPRPTPSPTPRPTPSPPPNF
jgi:hypothetical protein